MKQCSLALYQTHDSHNSSPTGLPVCRKRGTNPRPAMVTRRLLSMDLSSFPCHREGISYTRLPPHSPPERSAGHETVIETGESANKHGRRALPAPRRSSADAVS